MNAEKMQDEAERLRSLNEYHILDTLAEPEFDRIVALAARVCETPIALFSLVDDHRQWFKSRVGLDVAETSRAVSFCTHAVESDDYLVVEDATKDPRFVDNPLVLGDPDIRFYAGVPVRGKNRFPLGTLCVIDDTPRTLSDNDRRLLESLAREIEAQLEIRQMLHEQQKLVEERAILTNMIIHDARSVFGVIGWSLDLIAETNKTDPQVIEDFQGSVTVLQELCESVARINDDKSRGIVASPKPTDLKLWFNSAVTRCRTAATHAGINFKAHYSVPDVELLVDTGLLERIVGNLCTNAIQACSTGATIEFHARMATDETLELIVDDDGPGVAEADREDIFEPYFSGRNSDGHGTGLGLAICRLAAEAMGGSISYEPRKPHGARFVIDLPVRTRERQAAAPAVPLER